MRRALLGITIVGVASVLAGCPIYSNSSDYRVCNNTGCYDCPDPSYSGMCIPWSCSADSDCGSGYSCSNGQCVSGSGISPPPAADCSFPPGCPAGFVCKLSGGTAQCVSLPSEDGGAVEDATTGEGAAEFDALADAILSTDVVAIDAVLGDSGTGDVVTTDGNAPPPDASGAASCNADGDCPVGGKCIDGTCASEWLLCSDGTQCVVAGDSCVDGVCVPHCSASISCPTGYSCNANLGVCNVNPMFCAGSGTSSCQGGDVCVESRCVFPCTASDAGPTCPNGQVCVNGGCIPDERAQFACKNDGKSGLLANLCDPASTCLHHDCYTTCGSDAGACTTGICKNVTVGAGTYAVCGTATTLGSDCDFAVGAHCSGTGVCVDGYCR
jgi:hypothetical protein